MVWIVAAAVLYAWGVVRLARRGHVWAVSRQIPFAAGLVVLAVALTVGDGRPASFRLHVVQHLFLAMVAPLLLALGAPVTLLLQAGSRRVQRATLRVLHSRPVVAITHPIVAWCLFSGSIAAVYFTPLYAGTLRHPWMHDLVHLHFVLVGALFFWPVVGIDPARWRLHHGARLLYVALALPFHAIVGLALASSRAPLWSAHTLADQQAGGGVMMLGGDLITLAVVSVVLWQWMSAEERAADRSDVSRQAPPGRRGRYRTPSRWPGTTTQSRP